MSATLALRGTFLHADEPGTYADRESGEIKTMKRRTVVVLLDEGKRTIDLSASVDQELPESGTGVVCTVEVGARVVNFGKSAEPVFTIKAMTATKSSRRAA